MMQLSTKKKNAVEFFIKKKIFLSPELAEKIDASFNESQLYDLISEKIDDESFLFVNSDLLEAINNHPKLDLNWLDLERSRTMFEKDFNRKVYLQFMDNLKKETILDKKADELEKKQGPREGSCRVNMLFSYEE